VDYVLLTDRVGVRLSVPRWTAGGPARLALDHQRDHGRPQAQVSRFAAIGLGLQPDDPGFRFARWLALLAGVAGYVAVVSVLIVQAIPAPAGYHGH
jgi:hypothetical protein